MNYDDEEPPPKELIPQSLVERLVQSVLTMRSEVITARPRLDR